MGVHEKRTLRVVRLGNRNDTFSCKDTLLGPRTSLETRVRTEAERIVYHRSEALGNAPHVNLRIGMASLPAVDPKLIERTWEDVMDDILKDKKDSTLRRWETAVKDEAFDLIREKIVVLTAADDLTEVLRSGTVSTNVYLRRLQNHCLGTDVTSPTAWVDALRGNL